MSKPATGSLSGTDYSMPDVLELLRRGDERYDTLLETGIRNEITHVRELLELAQQERDKALIIQYTELLRRLTELNHAHEQAREKERDFINREAFDTFVARTGDDFISIREEIQLVAKAASEAREGAATQLAAALVEQNKTNDARFNRIENFQARLVGLALMAPLVFSIIVYLLARKGR